MNLRTRVVQSTYYYNNLTARNVFVEISDKFSEISVDGSIMELGYLELI